MMKEKTCVCIGIFLILALMCSCAMFYGVNGAPVTGAELRESAVSSPIAMMLSAPDTPNSAGLNNSVMLFSVHSGA